MIVNCIFVNVKPHSVEDFIKVTTVNHLESVKEPGNFRFDLVQQADDPTHFMLYEAYKNEEAAADHKNTAHYLQWREAVKDMMQEPRYGVKYVLLQPELK